MSTDYARRQAAIRKRKPENLLSAKQKLQLSEPHHKPLQQVVPDQFYYRGDYSHIKCILCGIRYKEAGPHGMYCDKCESERDSGLGYYAPGNWSARLANDRRRYSLAGLAGRKD